MKPKHTPGPWMSEGTTLYALNADGVNRFQAGFSVGFLAYPRHSKDVVKTPVEEVAANIALCKAAPDLLEALEAMLSHTDGWDETQLHKRWGEQVVSEILKARAAIEKAKGGDA